MLRVGQQAPDFTLPGVVGGRIDAHGLSEYTENGWAVVVVFYPFGGVRGRPELADPVRVTERDRRRPTGPGGRRTGYQLSRQRV